MYSFNETDDQLDNLNRLILSVIDKHAPLVKTKFTRPPATWMKDIKDNRLQREKLSAQKSNRRKLGNPQSPETKFEKPSKKTQFYRKVLSSKSSNLESDSSHF